VTSRLLAWKAAERRKPLIIRGARQVGKTTLVHEFATTHFKHVIVMNLERQSDLAFFRHFHHVPTLVDALFLERNLPVRDRQETLLFIDEIQESPEAIGMLRYFYEDVPDLPVIAAGSLLEHALSRIPNIPVGRVEYLYLHPMNFPEFLLASGYQQAAEALRQVPIQPHVHPTLLRLFHEYAIIGGMPEVVQTYLQHRQIADLPVVYEQIWGTYKDDVAKYASNDSEARVLKHVIRTAHNAIDQRIKFEHFGRSDYRSREVGEAFRNLDDARVIQLIYPTTDIAPPLKPDIRKSPRLLFLDTGLLNHETGIQAQLLGMLDLSQAYRGVLIPHLIMQEAQSLESASWKKPLFWVREKAQASAEVDLVVVHQGKAVPVEIKSGKAGTLRSLHEFIDRTDHAYAVRMYAGEFKIETHRTPRNQKPYFLLNLPYYLGTQLHPCLDYLMNHAEKRSADQSAW